MFSFRWRGQTPDQLARKYQRRGKLFRESQVAAVREAGNVVEQNVLARTLVAKKLNAQDSGDGSSRFLNRNRPTSVRTESDEHAATARITIRGFWSKARVRGELSTKILGVFSSLGKREALFRKGLWVKGRDGVRKFVNFATHGSLQRWAFRKDKGQQYFRHTVRLNDKGVLSKLFFKPSLAAAKDKILAIWRKATSEGFHK